MERPSLRSILIPAALACVCAVPLAAPSSAQEPPPPADESRPTREPQAHGTDLELALLDVLREKGLITEADYQELLALARDRADAQSNEITLIEASLQRLSAPDVQARGGQPGKLEFRSPDGKWSMGVGGWLQARYTDRHSSADGRDGSNFSVPRARLVLRGNAGRKDIKYKLEVDASTNTAQDNDLDASEPSEQKDARLKDAYVDYGVTETGSLRFGQYKFPFSREEALIPDSAGSLVEKSIASQAFAPKREPGASWWGKAAEGVFEYAVAVSNGDGENEPNMVESSALGTGDGMRYGARAVWNPLGEMKYDMSAWQTLDGPAKLALGLSYMVNHDARFTNTVIGGTAGEDAGTLGAELQWMIGPFSLLGEWYDRSTDIETGDDLDDDGYTLQAGCFLVPQVWELVARFSEVDQEDAGLAKTVEKTIGIDRYIDGSSGNKWMLDFVDLDNDTVSSQDETQVRLQYQVVF